MYYYGHSGGLYERIIISKLGNMGLNLVEGLGSHLAIRRHNLERHAGYSAGRNGEVHGLVWDQRFSRKRTNNQETNIFLVHLTAHRRDFDD